MYRFTNAEPLFSYYLSDEVDEKIATLQAEVDELKGINQTKETEIIILQKELEKNRSK